MINTPLEVNESQFELVRFVVRELGKTHFIIARGWHAPSTWTDGSFPIPGEGLSIPIDQFLLMAIDNPNFGHNLLQAFTKRAIEYGNLLIDAGVDAVQINADYCINSGPWLSPTQFRTFVLPYMQQQVDAYKKRGVYVLKHTDGKTWPLLEMMVGTGIDALHGIQPSLGMDIQRLKDHIGKQVCLFGSVEAETLINGTTEEIRQDVETCLKYGAPGGGFILTSSNSIQAGTRLENLICSRSLLKVRRLNVVSNMENNLRRKSKKKFGYSVQKIGFIRLK
jgi:uroporphyrinogen decarboxylase